MLVALRSWASESLTTRVRLSVQSDNIATLVLVAKMQSKSERMGLIARELALDIASACYSPVVVQHVPGVANIGADLLSRKFDPAKQPFRPPNYLDGVAATRCTDRSRAYWKSLPADSATSANAG